MYKKFFKRLLDIVLSTLAIVFLALPMLILLLVIRLDSPGPGLFRQKRVGINKKLFTLYKFRSMKVDTPDIPTHLLLNSDEHITRVGRWLRRTSLDELPQLFNIFAGKMSIIGPRPALWNQDDLIAERDRYGANGILPGLTGWAQVNGRDELDIAEKARYDGQYAGHITFKMDWTCFWMTVGSVSKQKGVIEGGTGAMAKQMKKRENEIREKNNSE